MMDAILAVAIGGNSLIGGKFSITGSIIGAYTIEVLNRTLLRLEVLPETIPAFKAVFIIILMVVASPVVRNFARKNIDRFSNWECFERFPGKVQFKQGRRSSMESHTKAKTRLSNSNLLL